MRLPNKPPHKTKRIKERKCIVTGAVAPCDDMIRFVRDPQGAVTPDLAANLPGRGAWVRAEKALVEKAAAGGAFSRAFERATPAGPGLGAAVEERLKARALSALGLARRAGALVAGFDQVAGVLKENKAVLLLTANDAASGGAQKLSRLARNIPVLRQFAGDELSQALGRDGVRHVALKDQPETARLVREILRFCGFAGPLAAEDEERACG